MGESILIIDDDEVGRVLLSDALSSAGYETWEAEDGEQGLRIYRENPADLVITDIMMPKKSGVWVVTKLLEEFPDARIIAISSATEGSDFLRMTKLLGAVNTLQKPVSQEDLLDSVEKALFSDST